MNAWDVHVEHAPQSTPGCSYCDHAAYYTRRRAVFREFAARMSGATDFEDEPTVPDAVLPLGLLVTNNGVG